MSSEGTIAIAAAVVALVQLWKWAGLRDSWAPLAVILLSVVGVMVWLVSGESWPPARTDVWPIATGIIAVTLSAAGTFGFTRAGASAVTRLSSPPPGGAGSEPSIKSGRPTAGIPVGNVDDGLVPVVHRECGGIAFWTSAPRDPGETIDQGEAEHADGTIIDLTQPVHCDWCSAGLDAAHVAGGVWVAVSQAPATTVAS